jgi:hypothetical protein
MRSVRAAVTSRCCAPSCRSRSICRRVASCAGDDPRPRGLQLGDPRLFRFSPAQDLLRALALGDVEDHPVQPRCTVRLDDALAALEHPHDGSVGPDDPILEGERPVLGRRRADLALHLGAVVRVDDAGKGPARVVDEVGRWIPGDAFDLVADHRHRPVGVEITAVDRPRDVGDERGELAIARVTDPHAAGGGGS